MLVDLLAAVRAKRLGDDFAKVVLAARRAAARADDAKVLWHQALPEQVEEPGEQLATRKVARGAEDDQDAIGGRLSATRAAMPRTLLLVRTSSPGESGALGLWLAGHGGGAAERFPSLELITELLVLGSDAVYGVVAEREPQRGAVCVDHLDDRRGGTIRIARLGSVHRIDRGAG